MRNDPIKKLIELARGGKSTSPSSLTQRVRGQLSKIEEALGLGVPRAELADALDMSLDQFAQALYRARRMERAGGDRRQPNPRVQTTAKTGGQGSSSPSDDDWLSGNGILNLDK